ncbi:dTDP-4-dehydrorhamnose reductase [Pseudoalteromonas sp. NBT06-2]|uniref:dTDP-4-dehydrorhamnose reductase n=1 Tax=Pseudoalteromonas sp. NBT06-2 TaxID=2025950 RepID=UPI000BA63474|nr:dTDP-4-dehydrorhamnose reductase [Pseudoalteromonas sp. NBT06-2]PAJ74140.1 dTDP-4-dehydrorhamnose reductase [Pseudoalteromonas sp. NBT06-2]
MKALIIGKNGQVAWELIQACPKHVHAKALGRNEINITNIESILQTVKNFKPEVIINASAYTAVDRAESEEALAFQINKNAVENLALVAKKYNIRFIHISTDFVFDGTQNSAYRVDDETNPINVYGASKLAGEEVIKRVYPENSIIIRTSWVYSTHGNNFVKTILRLMAEKESLNIVSDQIGSPTYAKGLAEYIWQQAELDSDGVIQNYSDVGAVSWYDFAIEIQNIAFQKGILSKTIPINPIFSSEYPTLAIRPKFSVLKLDLINKINWRDNLILFMDLNSFD